MPFDSLIQKINSMDVEATLGTKKKFSTDDIKQNYQKRFEIPILSMNRVSRGIYLSFDDFKNDKPSYPRFKFKISKYSADVTVGQNGKEIILTDYWGFFDGADYYIKPGLLPFKAIRRGNTFDLFGSLQGDDHNFIIGILGNAGRLDAGTSGYVSVPQSYVPIYPLQVDMETGSVY